MKNKALLVIGAIGFMTFISVSAFSQNVSTSNTSANKQKIRGHIMPASNAKTSTTTSRQSLVASNGSKTSNSQSIHPRVMPVSSKNAQPTKQTVSVSNKPATTNQQPSYSRKVKPYTPDTQQPSVK